MTCQDRFPQLKVARYTDSYGKLGLDCSDMDTKDVVQRFYDGLARKDSSWQDNLTEHVACTGSKPVEMNLCGVSGALAVLVLYGGDDVAGGGQFDDKSGEAFLAG